MGNLITFCPEPILGIFALFNSANSRSFATGITIRDVPFVTTKLIGEGGYAHIYEAVNNLTGEPVALKRYAFTDTVQQQAAMEEVSIYSSVCPHESIVTYLDSAIVHRPRAEMPEMFLVMELCEGPSLQGYINNRLGLCQSFTVSEVFEIVDNLIHAIGHLHAQSPPIAHWDIKPDNFLFTSQGTLKLCDFGSATRVYYAPTTALDISVAEQELDRRLTFLYRPPETIDLWEKKRVDTKVDMWALGVIIYVLIFRQMPFDANALEILDAIPKKYRKKPSSPTVGDGGLAEDPCPVDFRPLMLLVQLMLLVKNPDERADIFTFSEEFGKLTHLPPLERPRPGFQSAQQSRF